MADATNQATAKWLSIVGIGEDGLAGIGAAARQAIGEAEFVFGGARHLELARPAIKGEARVWPSPFDAAMLDVIALRGRNVCILASGDPFWHGAGVTIARHISSVEYTAFPASSSFSLAAARLGWALQDVETVSLHGRAVERLRPLLHDLARIIALTSDGDGPAEIAGILTRAGFGTSRLRVLEAIGGAAEKVSTMVASEIGDRVFGPLNAVAIEIVAGEVSRPIAFGGGLPDDLFEHDGQITKSDVRAMTLAALQPCRGQLLWDIGAGSGSVAISWLLCHPSMRAIAIEGRTDRADRIRRNAKNLGTPDLTVIEGEAPAALDGLPVPDAVFVGGGGSEPGVMDAAIAALKPGGRLIANAVTLEMEAFLLGLHARQGGELVQIALARAEPIGSMMGWRPAMPVTRWTWVKPR